MKFEDVQKLHDQFDCQSSWDDEEHFTMQAYAKAENELLVIRFGGFKNQMCLYLLPADSKVPESGKLLPNGISICGFENGILYGGEWYDDIPDGYEPYDPDSNEPGVVDVNMDQDWKLSDTKYLEEVAVEHVSRAAYELECYQKALAAIRNN